MFPRDPEPPEGDYYAGLEPNEPEADDYEPPTCERCGTVHDDWDRYCERCGYPVGMYARLKAEGQLEAYLAQVVDPEKAGF